MKQAAFFSLFLHLFISLAFANTLSLHPECSPWIKYLKDKEASHSNVKLVDLIGYNQFILSVRSQIENKISKLSKEEKLESINSYLETLTINPSSAPEDLFYDDIYLDQFKSYLSEQKIDFSVKEIQSMDEKNKALIEALKTQGIKFE